jgi:endonuclease YncB( thermonuclease family)
MSLASRIVTALLGLALILYYWPFWGSHEVITPVEAPPLSADARLFTKPDAPDETTHAIQVPGPETPAPETPAPAATDATQLAALKPEDTVAVKAPLKPQRFYRVVVRDGGTIEASGIVIALDGIEAKAADARCKDKTGRAWACGARSRVALMRLIRGRAVTCHVPISGKQAPLKARCTVGGTDLSTWMVSQGWAEAAAPKEPALASAADAARKKKIGIWR